MSSDQYIHNLSVHGLQNYIFSVSMIAMSVIGRHMVAVRHYARSRKVAVSIIGEVTGFLY